MPHNVPLGMPAQGKPFRAGGWQVTAELLLPNRARESLLLPTAVMGTKPGVVQPRSGMAARAFGRTPAYQLHVIMLALIPQEDSLCNLVSSNWLRASLLVSSGNFLDFDLAGIRSLWGETSP